MRDAPRSAPSVLLTLAAVVALVLTSCGVSGKPTDQIALTTPPSTTETTTTVPTTTTASTGTTEPGTTDSTTTPTTDGSNPFESDEFKKTYLGILKRAGYTDKEAKCVLAFVTKNDRGSPADPTPDLTKILTCLGSDGRPGGSD